MKTDLDLYTDYLLSSLGQTSATGLSRLLNNSISHDDVTDFLNQTEHTPKALWKQVKPFIRQIESDDGVLIVDDSISEKPYTAPMAWYVLTMTIVKIVLSTGLILSPCFTEPKAYSFLLVLLWLSSPYNVF